jgi:hypothetical protein
MSLYKKLMKAEEEHANLIFYLLRKDQGEGLPRHRLVKNLVFSMEDDGWILDERTYRFPYPYDLERILLLGNEEGRAQLRKEHVERLNKLYDYSKALDRALDACTNLGIISYDKKNQTYRLNPEYKSRFSKDRLEMAFYAAMLENLSRKIEILQNTSYDKIRPFAIGGYLVGLNHKTLTPKMLEELGELEINLFRSIDRVHALKFQSLISKALRDCSLNIDYRTAERRRRIFIRLFLEDPRFMRLLHDGDWNAFLKNSRRNPPPNDASEREIESGKRLVNELFDGLKEPFIFVTAPSDRFLRYELENSHQPDGDRIEKIIGQSIVEMKMDELHAPKEKSPIAAKDMKRETVLKVAFLISILLIPIVTVYGNGSTLGLIILAGVQIAGLILLFLFFRVRGHRRHESIFFDAFVSYRERSFERKIKERRRRLNALKQKESVKTGWRIRFPFIRDDASR